MDNTRRGFIANGAALGTLWAYSPVWAQAMSGEAMDGFQRIDFEGFSVIALADGLVARPLDAGFVKNADFADVQAALSSAGLPTDHIMVPYTPFVVLAGGKTYLMDTGFADTGPEGTGQLHANMTKAGINPSEIDVVLMSHFHGDHINGLRRKDGSLLYPEAQVYLPVPEYDFWMDADRMAAAPEAAQGGFRNVRRALDGYPEDRLVRFTPGDPIDDTFDTIACFGHAPGQTAYSIGSGADSFTYLADVAHYPALFVANPDWQVQFDMDPDAARETRHRMLGQMAAAGGLVGGYHFPFPHMGRLSVAGDGFGLSQDA